MRSLPLAVCVLAALAACFGAPSDADDDGVPDQRDNCPARANSDQADSLRDGVGDACRCDSVRCEGAGDACAGSPACDPRRGLCVRSRRPDGTRCDDGDACTEGDACRGGVCVSGRAVSCGRSGPCTEAACDRARGCVIRPLSQGNPCDDGSADTEVDTCDGRGACIGGCAVGRTTCGVACTSLATDLLNCGACGVRCNVGSRCVAGACACAAGGTACPSGSGRCTDLLTDASNCGRCGGVCPPGATCVGGVCTANCSSGATDCGGVCVQLESDRAHCGACGRACSAGQICMDGACLTPCGGGVLCGGACVSLTSDRAHCGGCGRACPAPAHAAAACVGGAWEVRCEEGYFLVGAAFVLGVPPPRLIAPLSTATVTTRRPTLRWTPRVTGGGARVQLCRDRACAAVVETIEATGASARPVGDLPTGVIFWRALGRVGSALGTETSATWQFTVGPRSAPVDTSWGSRLDVNGDGYADVVVSAPSTNRVFIYLGGAPGVGVAPTTTLTRPDGGFGYSIASAGDTNGDGYADLIVGAYMNLRAYVYLGGAAGVVDAPAATLVGPDASQFGRSVAGAGDVNGDGFADVVVGANLAVSSTGRAYVYLGASSGVSTTPSAILTGPDGVNGGFGSRVASAGDANGDGYADIVVGAPGAVMGGRAYVFAGSATGLAAAATTTLTAPDGGSFGWSVANAGDVNGDGYADIEVGAPYTTTNGRVYVYHGGVSGGATPATTLLDPDGSHQSFGVMVAGAGDINGDGYADVGIQGYCPTPGGCVYVHLGGAGGLAATPAATLLQVGFSNAATGVAGAGDVNADGYDDLIVGSSNNTARIYVGSAVGLVRPAATTLLGPDEAGSNFGFSVAWGAEGAAGSAPWVSHEAAARRIANAGARVRSVRASFPGDSARRPSSRSLRRNSLASVTSSMTASASFAPLR